MRLITIGGIAATAFFTVAPSAFAQTQTPASDTAQIQTFTGCLMKESDYRRAHNLGSGQVGGVGMGDEFMLVDVKVSAARAAATDTTPATDVSAAAASATTGTCADKGLAFRVTGTAEEQIKGLVGHQLEIQGRFKHEADAAAGGTRPDEKLPAEVEIVSFREVPAPAMTEPAAPTAATPPTTPPQSTTPRTATPPATPPAATPPATVEQPRVPAAATPPAPAAATTTERRELPRTASSAPLLAMIGVLALGAGVALTALRRRVS